jgi:hypothetical protein
MLWEKEFYTLSRTKLILHITVGEKIEISYKLQRQDLKSVTDYIRDRDVILVSA